MKFHKIATCLACGLVVWAAAAGTARGAIELNGDALSLGFDETAYALVSMRGGEAFGEIAAGRSSAPLWLMTLKSDRGRGETFETDAMAACERSHEIEKTSDGVVARLTWRGLDVADEKGVLDVVATVTIPNGSTMAHWEIAVANRSEVFGLWDFVYPNIEIAPPDPDLAANRLVNTFRMGELNTDPFNTKPDKRGRTLFKVRYDMAVGNTTKAGQFMALYGENGRGFYFASRDARGYKKRIRALIVPQTPRVVMGMSHMPENYGFAGEDYAMNYDVVSGFYRGDWYDACQIYRDWVMRQEWTRKGPLVRRADVPQWVKDATYVLRLDARYDGVLEGDVKPADCEQTARNEHNSLKVAEWLGGGDGWGIWYSWWMKDPAKSAAPVEFLTDTSLGNDGQLRPPVPMAPETNRRLLDAGIRTVAYINGILYDHGDAGDYAPLKECVELGLDGKPQYRMYKGKPHAVRMCRACGAWRDRYALLVTRLARDFGFSGVYCDSYSKDGHPCFSTEHGHPYGGGDKYIQAARGFGRHFRDAMRAVNPDVAVSAEASTDEFVDLVDLRLAAMAIRRDVAPVYSVVYHDYQTYYGRKLALSMEEVNFAMTAGYQFVMGFQMGRIFVNGRRFESIDPEIAPNVEFLKTLVAHKRAAREFLNTGRMTRPPEIVSDVPNLTCNIWYKNQEVTLPSVLCASYRAVDKPETALVFANCATEAQTLRYRFDAVEYGFPAGSEIPRTVVSPDGAERLPPVRSGKTVESELTLAPRSARVIVLGR